LGVGNIRWHRAPNVHECERSNYTGIGGKNKNVEIIRRKVKVSRRVRSRRLCLVARRASV
jgi:hypothetical protein